jgi:hypothetical protein
MVAHDGKKPKLLEVSRQHRVLANCLPPPCLYIFSEFGQNIHRRMKQISPSKYAEALSRQKSFTDAEWLQRCDELATQQPVLFFELTTFFRDGVREDIARRLIDYLSVLQFASKAISESVSAPIALPEFQAATERTMKFFYAITTDDPAHFSRMMEAWFNGVMEKSDPVVWAGCIETLKSPEVKDQPLFKKMVCKLASIADAYAFRL